MAFQIEVQLNKKTRKKLQTNTPEVYEFIRKLNMKHEGWEEFVLGNDREKELRLLKSVDNIKMFSKNLDLMHLLMYLDRTFLGWTRFAITKADFSSVDYEDCEVGMLIRPASTNTNNYLLITEIQTNSKGKRELIVNQEGNQVKITSRNFKRYKPVLLLQSVEGATYEELFGAVPA